VVVLLEAPLLLRELSGFRGVSGLSFLFLKFLKIRA
jgi:hypothetical protein